MESYLDVKCCSLLLNVEYLDLNDRMCAWYSIHKVFLSLGQHKMVKYKNQDYNSNCEDWH